MHLENIKLIYIYTDMQTQGHTEKGIDKGKDRDHK